MDKIVLSGKTIPVLIIYKNIRHTYLRIKPDNTLYITTSKRINENAIEAFIKSHENQIMRSINRKSEPLIPLMSDKISIFGIYYPTVFNPNLKSLYLFDGQVFYYKNETTKLKSLKSFYAKLVIDKSFFLLDKWSISLSKDFNVDHIIIKSQWMKSQFGSCQSSKRVINMNSILAYFDITYLEAILLHELVHLKVQNHGNDFYTLLYKYLPRYPSIRKELGHLFKRIEM